MPVRTPYRPGQRRSGGRRSSSGTSVRSRGPRPSAPIVAEPRAIELSATLTVKELADVLRLGGVDVIKELMKNGIMAAINQTIDYDAAAVVATDLGFEVKPKEVSVAETLPVVATRRPVEEDTANLQGRPPVVTVMGHVDHGKTSLLDAIRETKVAAGEAGGITQHIGAYQVEAKGHKITFLDTPGHAAFTAMRARGAQITDIAVLVVAADDGVMPQTIEAIDHAKAAAVPIVVAVNKVDKPGANPDRVRQELADHGVLIEEWGGDVPAVNVSAKRRTGIDDLLDNILVVAEVQELKANPDRPAIGAIVEAKLDKTRGPLATVLVQTGTLNVSDFIVVGETYGKIKAMFNDKGKRIKAAGPAVPAEILGLNVVPQAGDVLKAVPDEKTARMMAAEIARLRERERAQPQKAVTLDDLFAQIQAGTVRELNIILKTDVQGTIQPIKDSLEKLEAENVKVRVLHTGTGSVTESDIMLAVASKAIIIGFNTRPEPGARRLADQEGVDIRLYSVIYNVVDDVKAAMAGLLEPKFEDVVEGHAEVRQVFKIGRHEQVAGSYVVDGKISRSSFARVRRGNQVIHEGKIAGLKRFKDDAREVAAGYECGIGLETFHDFQVGDQIEAYKKERVTPTV